MAESFRYNVAPILEPGRDAPLRGCCVCDYGRQDGGYTCTHPEGKRPTLEQRRRGSACGPEAKFLTIKGVEL